MSAPKRKPGAAPSWRVRAAAAAAMSALSGCAVLEVSVDVYKGPLVNHEEIQTRQVASIAMTARTLLVTMRNHLLRAGLLREDGDTQCAKLTLARPTAYMPSDDLERCLKPANVKALQAAVYVKQLNNVLGLYEDLPASDAVTGFDPSFTGSRGQIGLRSLAAQLEAAETKGSSFTEAVSKASYERKLNTWAQREALYRALIDLAGRLSFLAVNIHLIDPDAGTPAADTPNYAPTAFKIEDQETKRFKYTLEAVGNTLLVHADDLRHRMKHEERQLEPSHVQREAESAQASFGQPLQATRRFAQQLDLELGLARQREKSEKELEAKVKVLEAQITAKTAEVGTLKSSLDERSTTVKQLLALRAVLLGGAENCRAATVNESTLSACVKEAAAWHNKNKSTAPTEGITLESTSGIAKAFLEELEKTQRAAQAKATAAAATASAAQSALQDFSDNLARLARAREALTHIDQTPAAEPSKSNAKAAGLLADRTTAALKAAEIAHAAAQGQHWESANSLAALKKDKQPALKAPAANTLMFTVGELTSAKEHVQLHVAEVQRTLVTLDKDKDVNEAKRLLIAQGSPSAGVKKVINELRVPATTASGFAATGSALEVLDTVIAQMRYQHLARVREKGKDSPDAMYIEQAIAQAFKQRAGMAYLRPSSAYLRSVFAATANQDKPVIGWTNLLTKNPTHILSRFVGLHQDDDVRIALDKASWQNINTVRLTGAGNVNYVVAKDDVGNWYVKAMGADPGAMINAAKGLALYNLGGKLPANLLRIDELRQRIDNPDTENPARERAETELQELRDQAGAKAPAGSVSLFQNRYQADGASLIGQLKDTLEGDNLPTTLQGHWKKTYPTGDKAKTLEGLLQRDDIHTALSEAAIKAKATPSADDKAPSAASIIHGTLKALRQATQLLRSAVLGEASLAEKEEKNLKEAQANLIATGNDIKAKQTQLVKAKTESEKAAGEASAADSTSPPPDAKAIKELRANAKTAADIYAGVLSKLAELQAKQQQEMTNLETAQQALSAANTLRSRAAQNVDAVLGKALADAIQERRRQMAEFETAIKVLGQLPS